jgi:hypothetical protein
MPAKPRVFISSTMEDLANERQAVAAQLIALNFEPVWAEELYPNGSSSWSLLAEEIRNSHMVILLLGDRYGWIPDSGYGYDQRKSVTHLEIDLARQCGLTVLPFFKRLKGAGRDPEEARRRDEFRQEIGSWASGQFRTEFDLAGDLAEKIHLTLLHLLTDSWWKQRVRNLEAKRAPAEEVVVAPVAGLQSGKCLFAGAGLSVSAGYPTAAVLAEVIARRLDLDESGAELLGRYTFADIASLAEDKLGRSGLIAIIRDLLDTPLSVAPTEAHVVAVQKFRSIITTNYDPLFERACDSLGMSFAIHTPHGPDRSKASPDVSIYKLDGTIDQPLGMILTASDAYMAASDHKFWSSVASVLDSIPVLVVGHSMRDSTTRRLIEARNRDLQGVYVSPYLTELDQGMLRNLNLVGVKAMPADYFRTA